MTNIKKEAEWVKKERQLILKLHCEINSLIFAHILRQQGEVDYLIDYSTSTNGKRIELRIANMYTFENILSKEVWCLDSIFEDHLNVVSTKEAIKKNTKQLKAQLRAMKRIAQEYISLNETKLKKH